MIAPSYKLVKVLQRRGYFGWLSGLNAAAFSLDGQSLVSGIHDNTLLAISATGLELFSQGNAQTIAR
ncbi:MAG TPA: hypothetical protein V6D37_17205 [Candidatus Sericytochromatia bacterium]